MAATVPPAQTPWLVGLCSVIFDVDVGQTVQHVVPEGAFTTDEESAISFCSFPVRVVAVGAERQPFTPLKP